MPLQLFQSWGHKNVKGKLWFEISQGGMKTVFEVSNKPVLSKRIVSMLNYYSPQTVTKARLIRFSGYAVYFCCSYTRETSYIDDKISTIDINSLPTSVIC